ncbi:MAG TPA: hypothetical protein VMZ03_05395 [Chitinophagaceae bacterium]|nr:hypothetical protein [Chitinophagaceae bacterium]
MKKTFLLPLICIVLFACQKEIDWSTPGVVDNGPVLYRIKSKTGATDTTQTDYFYDANKRVIRELINGIGNGQDLNNDLIITRNGSGIITKTVQKAAALLAGGIDSIVTNYNYNTTTSQYTYSVFQLTVAGFTVRDSAVYTYASGRISKDEHYLQVTGLPIPIPPVLAARNTYTYSADGKNLLSVSTDAATAPGGPLSPATAQTFTVDAKVNALIILNEGVLLGRLGLYSANNSTKMVVTNTIDPTQDFTMDLTYRYNTANKPDSSYGTRSPGGTVTASKYYYQ